MFRNLKPARKTTRRNSRKPQLVGAVETLESRILLAADFGDAPQGIEVDGVLRNYPTVDNGIAAAQHGANVLQTAPFLGATPPDMEVNGQPNATATGDDTNGTDDEDGVSFGGDTSGSGMVAPGENFTANASVTGTGYINVWVDWNVDGDWDDTDEHIVDNDFFETFGTTFPAQFMGTAPANAAGGTTFFRVRVSSEMISTPGGSATDGEVEDYAATIVASTCSLVVTTTADTGVGSLREAIVCANDTPGPNTISFAIPGAGPHTIQPLSQLPALSDVTGGTTIDGYTQAGASENTNAFEFGNVGNQGLNTVLQVAIDGSLAPTFAHGITLQADGNTIQGLSISGFNRNEIEIQSDNNTVRGTFVSTDVSGTTSQSDRGNAIHIDSGSNNTLGGTSPGDRNLISGNVDEEAIRIDGPNSDSNTIQGNLIGTTITGMAALANQSGINLTQGASNTLIGGTTTGAGNVISGNQGNAISLFDGDAPNTVVQGNYVGTNVAGTSGLANRQGIIIGTPGVLVGGTQAGAGNLISGNELSAVQVFGPSGGDNGSNATIQGNLIGTDVTGTAAIPNIFAGGGAAVVLSNGTTGNLIGGTADGAENLISGNSATGIEIIFSDNNTVQGNLIGTNNSGTTALPNAQGGILIRNGSRMNLIGGTAAGAGNVISGNQRSGIEFEGYRNQAPQHRASNNTIQGNLIGTDITGTVALGNGFGGIVIEDVDTTMIGGTTAQARNIVSGTQGDGIRIAESAEGTVVQGNYVGTDFTGTVALGNRTGIQVNGPNSRIGGTAAGAGNLVSGNVVHGVALSVSDVGGTTVQGNLIGTDPTATQALGNGVAGVLITSDASILVGGASSAEANVISGNGVGVLFDRGSSATIQGNLIGTDITGNLGLANTTDGIVLSRTSSDNSITGNVISGNSRFGINITNGNNNSVFGNTIGTTLDGTTALSNGDAGVNIPFGSNNQIGGSGAGQGNLIAANGGAGVAVGFSSINNSILGNSIFENDGLGIDLGSSGVTPNDPQDSDMGANNGQNFPVLTSAATGSTTMVSGTLNSTPNRTFTIEFFSNTVADVSGSGEGQTFLGRLNVTTDASGNAPINFDVGSALADGLFISATATDTSTSDTSEFSANVVTEEEVLVCSLVVTTTADVVDGSDSVNSLREAITCANMTAGAETITLNPGTYVLTIGGASENNNATGDLDITDDLTIRSTTGNAADVVISGLDSSGESPRFMGDRIFNVIDSVVNFTGLTIRDGVATFDGGELVFPDFGGGIYNEVGTVTLTNSVVTNNTAAKGGGIATIGDSAPATLILDNTKVINNLATGNQLSLPEGGGIYAVEDSVTLRNNTLVSNNTAVVTEEDLGSVFSRGGGIAVFGGTLDIDGSEIRDNQAIALRAGTGNDDIFTGFAEGGGIYMNDLAVAEIDSSLIRNNVAQVINPETAGGFGGRADGGGIYSAGELTINLSYLDVNQAIGADAVFDLSTSGSLTDGGRAWGGGIFNSGILTVDGSYIAGNLATGGGSTTGSEGAPGTGGSAYGAGIYSGAVGGSQSVTVINSRISSNIATGGGGTGLGGNAYGGGIYSDADFTLIENSLIDANEAIAGESDSDFPGGEGEGGGVWLASGTSTLGPLGRLINSTVSGNQATSFGGGVYISSAGSLLVLTTNATIANNRVLTNDSQAGGGIFNEGATIVELDNTIVATNLRGLGPGATPDDLSGTYMGISSLIGVGEGHTGIVDGVDGNQVGTLAMPIDPLLGPLMNNGGGDPTHALLDGSPAIDAGNNTLAQDSNQMQIPFDQRGPAFPRVVNFTVDIGAFETIEAACTLIVTNTNDTGFGSLREAIDCANDTLGLDTITFAIPSDGPHIISPLSELPVITDPVTIDGYSQGSTTATSSDNASPNTLALGSNADIRIVIDGSSAGSAANGITLAAGSSGSTITGLNIRSFAEDGIDIFTSNNTIAGNHIGTNVAGSTSMANGDDGIQLANSANNTIGGSSPADRNVISGNGGDGISIQLPGSSNNRVENNYIGVSAAGTMILSNEDDGIDLDSASNNRVLNNVVSGNFDDGIEIDGGIDLEAGNAFGNIVQGNFIGTDATGMVAIGNLSDGVTIQGATDNLIGGSGEGQGNLISGNLGSGVSIVSSAEHNIVQGNMIGTDLAGGPLCNDSAGVLISDSSFNLIGGVDSGEGNEISANASDGVAVVGESVNNPILSNSIFDNGDLGIDLGDNGPTPNDNLDGDSGPNNQQNFPVITSVSNGATTVVQGSLNSLPNTSFRIEFFANDALDPSGFGEGQTFLGFVNVNTDSSGNAVFTFNAGQLIAADSPITSTATRFMLNIVDQGFGEGELSTLMYFDTSEFSAPAPEQETADLSLTKTTDNPSPEVGETVTFTLTISNAGPSAATNVEVTDLLPTGLTFVASTASQGGYIDGNGVWMVGTVPVDGSATLEIMTLVQTTDQITNTAEVTASDQFDPDSMPNNQAPGEDDFATAGVGQCLFGLDGPLMVGYNTLVYSCVTPGSISAFVMGTEFGSHTYEQYDQMVDIDDPEVQALGVANPDGIAVVKVLVPPAMAGSQVIFQAFEMSPNSNLSNTLVLNVANVPLTSAAGEGSGASPVVRSEIESVFEEALARWRDTNLSADELARLDDAQFRLLDLPEGLVGSALNTTVYIDRTAAGHGWFVDPTPAEDSEFSLGVSANERITVSGAAVDRFDLLTVMMHELGHVLGHSDEAHTTGEPSLMHHVLPRSTRRLPTDLPEADISQPLHNYDFAEDVNGDGNINLTDALELVAQLRAHGSRHAADIIRESGGIGLLRYDVSGDNQVTLNDALLIVAHIRNARAGEGEAVTASNSSNRSESTASTSEPLLSDSSDFTYESAVDAVLASYADDED